MGSAWLSSWEGAGKESPRAASQCWYSSFPPAAVTAFWARWMLLTIPTQHSVIRVILIFLVFLFLSQDNDHVLSLVFPDFFCPAHVSGKFLEAKLVFCCLCGLGASPSDLRGTATLQHEQQTLKQCLVTKINT